MWLWDKIKIGIIFLQVLFFDLCIQDEKILKGDEERLDNVLRLDNIFRGSAISDNVSININNSYSE
ncbi:MAG: hypothetical protein LBI53_05610 [Candidatus Peribacteria bacterium]|jgi:hypothetical protein|nr:hypothetical protein [Candidatus Peribacteria bacterium]